MAGKRTSDEAKSRRVFGQARKQPKMFRAALYTRVSTNDQQTIPLQIRALREYAARRGWTIALQVKEVGSGASQRQLREKLLDAARRREIDVSAGVALGPVGPVRGGPAGNTPGTGPPRSRFRLPDRSPGPVDAGWPGHGRSAGRVRRVRKGYSPRASARRPGACPADRQEAGATGNLGTPYSESKAMKKPNKDPIRENRIHNEAIADANGPEEQAMGWYYYLDDKIRFPFQTKCIAAKLVSPLRNGEAVAVQGMAPEDVCERDMLVLIRWQNRNMAVPLSQLVGVDLDESTAEAIGDWHYWVAQGYYF